IDAGLTVAANAGRSPVDVHAAVAAAATARSRWHRLPAGVSLVIDRLLHATRQAVAGRGSIAPDDVAQLKLWAGRPGFYGELARSADVGAGGAYLKYTEADLLLLQAVERNDGQVGAVREALGPLQVAATRTWGNQGEQAAQIFGAVGPLGQVGFEGFVDQFGITGRFADGLGWAMAGILWDGFTSPFQTWHQFRFTDRALDLMEELQRTRSDDLLSLGRALDSAVHALESMQRALTHARLGDPGSLLGGRGANELQDVLDGYRRAFDAAPPGFRDAHRGELDDRSGHIRQKLAQLQTIVAALRQLEASLPNMTTWLDALRKNPDGSVRSVLGLFNPEAFVRLGSVGMALGQMVTKGLLLDGGVAAPPPDAPSGWPPPGPSYDFPDDDATSPEPEEHESTMSDAEFEEYKRTH
ncbi:MAG TPA: hypothetical protein VFV35_06185, partial [Acidimicrobiales bacterium]|nr:hypothetical protein [Acidimicrobiales bacterium]